MSSHCFKVSHCRSSSISSRSSFDSNFQKQSALLSAVSFPERLYLSDGVGSIHYRHTGVLASQESCVNAPELPSGTSLAE